LDNVGGAMLGFGGGGKEGEIAIEGISGRCEIVGAMVVFEVVGGMDTSLVSLRLKLLLEGITGGRDGSREGGTLRTVPPLALVPTE